MAETDVRNAPTRGRSSTRGGRGSFGRGGPRGGRKVNGTSHDAPAIEESLDDQGELGEMKRKYLAELGMLRDMFPDWTDTDLVFALEEADGDIPATVDRITQGAVSQFAEVKKTKDRARSRIKDESAMAGATDKPGFAARGGRGRGGFEGTRGGRARGSDRSRGGVRGGRGGHATINGAPKEAAVDSVPTTESTAWDTTANATAAEGGWDHVSPTEIAKEVPDAGQSAWGNIATSEATSAAASEGAKSSLIPEGGAKKSWASMFAQPKPAPAPVPVKQLLTKQNPPAELAATETAPEPAAVELAALLEEGQNEPVAAPMMIQEPQHVETAPEPLPAPVQRPVASEGDELMLTPSKDPLTEENVEHLPDESNPPATQTVASTTGSFDPRNLTPLPSLQAPIGRPPMGGYATAANRLAGTGGRSASFQRRVLEQQEAVVMPGHNALDRAAVQFGSMGLNGEAGLDVDDDREEPETRQAPQHSPPSQPRTSLPPAPRQTATALEAGVPEGLPTPKQAPGLPPASVQNQQQIQDPSLSQSISQDPQMNQAYNQYGRYGQPSIQQETGAQQQKQYDPFSHQAQQTQFEQYASHAQQQQQQAQSGFGGLSSAPSEYSSYYTSDQPRGNYSQYYGGSYAQPDARTQAPQAQHEGVIAPPRSTSGFTAGQNESTFAAQAAQQQAQSRFSEAPGSGNNTPNPLMGGQQPSAPSAQQSQHSMHQAQGHQQQGGYPPGASAAFPYGHPYYNSPYQAAYANQFGGYSGGMGGYNGGGYPSKQQGGMYGGAPYGHGMGSQSSYDQHSASPANANAFSQNQQASMRSTSGMGSALGGLDEYGRGSAPAGTHQQSSAFGGMTDPFARSASGFGTQGGFAQQNMTSGAEEALKPFNDSKSGPSPALGQPGRPGSAANGAVGSGQPGLPPPQSQHSAFGGGYPGFPGQASQYGGLGGLGSQQQQPQQPQHQHQHQQQQHQQHQQQQQQQHQHQHQQHQHQQSQAGMGGQSAYAQYGGGFGQTYGGYGGSRGGWGANYGGH